MPGLSPPRIMDNVDEAGYPAKDSIVREAHKRFNYVQDWEAQFRMLFQEDLKFANADSDNGWQWPNNVWAARDIDAKPRITINMVRQHNLMIINDAKQNKPQMIARPVGDEATYESAQAITGLFRHIEYQSNAQVAYDTMSEFQVACGYGCLRPITKYVDDKSFDQDIFIERIVNPLSVYMDPDAKELDRSDAEWGFVFEDLPLDEFKRKFPKYKNHIPGDVALSNATQWLDKDHIRIAEYFRAEYEDDVLFQPVDEQGMPIGDPLLKSMVDKGTWEFYNENPRSQKRKLQRRKIMNYTIVGNEKGAEKEVLGPYIPLVVCIGEERLVQGRLDRKGHTRNMKDAQRVYNYWTSAAVEQVALQTKTPWVAPAKSIEGYETYWTTANTVNHSVLPYNPIDDEGNAISPPQRTDPPQMSQGYIQGMQISRLELMSVSGQFQNQMGQPGNERTGKAIQERQRQGDTATYHFIDNHAVAIRYLAKIIMSWIPFVYNGKRVIQILDETNQTQALQIDPSAAQAYMQQMNQEQEVVKRILNPSIGQYDCQADIGPAYATKREEAFNAFVQIITQAPQLMPMIGDILFRNADMPGAEEAAKRFAMALPPELTGKGPSPQVQQLTQQLQTLQQTLQAMATEYTELKLKYVGKEEKRDIDVYSAETNRLKVLLQTQIDEMKLGVGKNQQLFDLMTGWMQANAKAEPELAKVVGMGEIPTPQVGPQQPTQQQLDLPGILARAQQAPDGKHYVEHSPGKFAEVVANEPT